MMPEWYRRLDETYGALGLGGRFLLLFVAIMSASAVGRLVPDEYGFIVRFTVVAAVICLVLGGLVAGVALVRGPRPE
jgi:hypothetical protein